VGRLLIVVALGATVIVPVVLGGKDALLATLHLSAQEYAAIFILIATSWFSRTLKLHLLLRRLNLRPSLVRVLGISLATDFAFIATPAGIGGYAACLYYLRRVGASGSSAAAIIAADQGLDVLFFVLALPLAALGLIWSSIPNELSTLAFTTSALMILLGLSVLLARRKLARWLFEKNSLTRRWPRLISIQNGLHEFSLKLRREGRPLLTAGPIFLVGIFVVTALQQLTRYGILWIALLFLGHRVSFMLIFLLQTLVLQAALWTGIPAGGGAADIGLTAALALWVPKADLATALLLWRAATLYVCLVAGAIAIALLARGSAVPSNRDTY
jgi:uncharacterized protein (TIRG00374 family)